MNKLIGSLALSLLAPAVIGQCVAPSATATSYGSGDDFVANAGLGIDLGFAFPFAGTTYQYIHPSSNGFLYLSDGTPTLTNSDLSPSIAEFYTLEPRIAVLWDDLNLLAGNGGDLLVDTSVVGQCTITWFNTVLYGQTSLFNVQVTLNVSGEITYSYDGGVYQITDTIVGTSPGFGTATASASIDLSAGLPVLDDMCFQLFAADTFDMAGQQLSMIPLVPGYFPAVSSNGCASSSVYGTGCIRAFTSFYELFTTGGNDLAGSSLLFTPAGGSYVTIVNAGSNLQPVGSLATPTPVTLTDDSSAAVGTLGLVVGSNGWVALGAGNSTAFTPTVATMLGNPAEAFYFWHDMNPTIAGSGQVQYEELGTQALITYDGVYSYGTTDPSVIQVAYDSVTGIVECRFDVISALGNGWLVGQSAAGASADPGAIDISAAGVIVTDSVDIVPLSLDSNAPVLGANWDLTTTNIDAVSPISITFFGLTQAALPLQLVFPSAPANCSIYVDTLVADSSSPNLSGTSTLSLPIPTNQALVGAILTAQSICLTITNPSNLLTSNGVQGVLGN